MTLTEFLLARITEDEYFGTHDSHLAKRWDAECKAKRRIVEAYVAWDADEGPYDPDYWSVPTALEHLAAVYAHHPDYREEWRI